MNIYELFVDLETPSDDETDDRITYSAVYCYVPAEDLEESIDKLKEKLTTDDYGLLEIESVRLIDLELWEEEDNEDCPTLAELQQALTEGYSLYSTFFDYQAEYDD